MRTPASGQGEFILRLRPVPGNWQVPPEMRLRAALKRLLRNYGLRAVACRPAPDNFPGNDAPGSQGGQKE
jgi:hypothetical protein